MADETKEEQTEVTAVTPADAPPPTRRAASGVTLPRWGVIVGGIAILVLLLAGTFAAGMAVGGHDDRGHMLRDGSMMGRPGDRGMQGGGFGQRGDGMGMQGDGMGMQGNGMGMQGNGYGPGAQQVVQPDTTPAPSATASGQ